MASFLPKSKSKFVWPKSDWKVDEALHGLPWRGQNEWQQSHLQFSKNI